MRQLVSRQDNMATVIMPHKGSLKIKQISSKVQQKQTKNAMSQSNLFSLQALIEIRFYITQCVPYVKGKEKNLPTR